jgi:type VI secretion system protein ImpG
VFENYYQNELSYLREMGRAFAAAHPAIAGMLAERGGDPDVERLLEGFAFVAAKLRQRVDDGIPELVESLAEIVIPHALRPTPATTIVEFRPPHGGARGRERLRQGAGLLARQVRGTACRFTTSRDLDLLPVRLTKQTLDDSSQSRPEIRFQFVVDEGATASVFSREGLRLHLHGELPIAAHLYLWLARHCSGVAIRTSLGECELGNAVSTGVGFAHDDTLFPWPSFSSPAFRLLIEYFAQPAKFLFVDIMGLERAAHLAASSFELVLRFSKPPRFPARLPEDTVRLHCVPAANVFTVSAEPIRSTIEGRSSLIRPAGMDPLHAEVFDVRSVVGISSKRSTRQVYEPFHAFGHAMPRSHGGFYKLTREPSPVDDGVHTYLRIDSTPPAAPLVDDETLSIELLATNRALPNELGVGDVCVSTRETPSQVSFANISLVTRPQTALLGSELTWQLLGHLGSSRRTLADVATLREFLSLANLQERTDQPVGRANRARIDALRSVRVSTVTRVMRGAAVRGTLYQIDVDEAGFDSEGDAFLFGSVLHQVYASTAPVNSFAEIEFTLKPGNLSFRWTHDQTR